MPPTEFTSRQTKVLNKAIISYLDDHDMNNTVRVPQEELGLDDAALQARMSSLENLVERMRTGAPRLDKRILDLEQRNTNLESQINNMPTSISVPPGNPGIDPILWLPPQRPKHVLAGHASAVNAVAFHPVFSSLASASDDCTIMIWDRELGELECVLRGHTRAVIDVEYGGAAPGSTGTAAGALLASCSSDLTAKLWDPANGYAHVRTLRGHEHSVSAVRFVPAAAGPGPNLLATASRDASVKLWDVTGGHCIRTLRGHSGWVRALCPSADGRFLVSCGDDRTVRAWRLSPSDDPVAAEPALPLMSGHEQSIECCAVAPPTAHAHLLRLAATAGEEWSSSAPVPVLIVATGSRDKMICVWDAIRGICLLVMHGHESRVRAVVFHPGGRYLLSASDDGTVQCRDLADGGRCVRVLADEHGGFVTCLRWAPSAATPSRGAAIADAAASPAAGRQSEDAEKGEEGVGSEEGEGTIWERQAIRCVVATGSVDGKVRVFE